MKTTPSDEKLTSKANTLTWKAMEKCLFVRVDGVYCRDQIGSETKWNFEFRFSLCIANFRSKLQIFFSSFAAWTEGKITEIESQIYQKAFLDFPISFAIFRCSEKRGRNWEKFFCVCDGVFWVTELEWKLREVWCVIMWYLLEEIPEFCKMKFPGWICEILKANVKEKLNSKVAASAIDIHEKESVTYQHNLYSHSNDSNYQSFGSVG